MSQLIKLALCCTMAWFSSAAMATDKVVDTKDPYAMIKTVATNTFDRFHDDYATIKANPDHLKKIVSDEMMPYIDYKYSAYKVLGPYLRKTTRDQRTRFTDAFKDYLVVTYAQAFTEYTNQKVNFSPKKDFSHKKIIDINVQIVEAGRPPIKIQFRVRRLKDNTWKAFDMVAEGVSLLSSKRTEFSNLIRQNGIDSVIKNLDQITTEPIKLKTKGTKH